MIQVVPKTKGLRFSVGDEITYTRHGSRDQTIYTIVEIRDVEGHDGPEARYTWLSRFSNRQETSEIWYDLKDYRLVANQ